jgi:hypothetical protein
VVESGEKWGGVVFNFPNFAKYQKTLEKSQKMPHITEKNHKNFLKSTKNAPYFHHHNI